MKILVVAPEVAGLPRLAVWDEMARIGDVASVTMEVLGGGGVTRERVMSRLRRAPCDIVLWIGHGVGGNLFTAQGEIEPHWLATELKRASVWLLVLSVCDSAQRAEWEGFADLVPAAGCNFGYFSLCVTVVQ